MKTFPLRPLLAALAGLLVAVSVAPPVSAGSPVVPEPRVRLVVAGGAGADGHLDAGVEIRLPPDWHTYWRNPGDSGIPPAFDTTGSANLAGIAVRYPAPTRYFDGYGTSIVYHAGVLLPVEVTPIDPRKPVDLKLKLTFGFCREICVPGSAALEALLDPAAPADPDETALIADALARVPVAEAHAPQGAPRLAGIATQADAILLTVTVDDPDSAPDLFAEPPEGWYLPVPEIQSQAPGQAVFRLSLKGKPKAASLSGATFRFTLTGGTAPVEAVRTIE